MHAVKFESKPYHTTRHCTTLDTPFRKDSTTRIMSAIDLACCYIQLLALNSQNILHACTEPQKNRPVRNITDYLHLWLHVFCKVTFIIKTSSHPDASYTPELVVRFTL